MAGEARPAPSRRSRSPRSLAREAAVQALYQWQLTGQDPKDICNQFLAEAAEPRRDEELFKRLVVDIPARVQELDGLLDELADRPVRQIDPVEHGILLVGLFELQESPEVPFRVVINEAVELARAYGAEDGHRYVNAVLDRAARRLRSSEDGAGS